MRALGSAIFVTPLWRILWQGFFCESMQVVQKHEDTGSLAHMEANEV